MPIDRDTFMQVRQHVIETAPAGLSKAQFDALLDQEIAKSAAPTAQPGRWEDKGIAGKVWHPPAGSGDDLHRPDNSLFGMPPEMVVVPALGVGRAIAGGATMAGRAVAGAKEVVNQTAPALKYEVTKAALEHVGVPSPIAIPIALAVSGYKRGAKPAAAATTAAETEATTAARAAQGASSPAAPAPPAASGAAATPAGAPPAAAPSAPPASLRVVMSPQRIQNELGIAARRAKVTLTEPEYDQAAELVAKQGLTPVEAVARMKPPPVPPPSAASVVEPPPVQSPQAALAKARLNGAESTEYMRLIRSGKTPPQALQAIEEQRALAKRFGTPDSETVRKAVKDRNATGRWGTTK